MFPLPTTQSTEPGQNWMWAVYPLPGDLSNSVRVNLLIDTSTHPPVYESPYIETSIFVLREPAELRSLRTALDQAELKALEWAEKTGETAYECN